ncbi:MAG: TetR/AcrR family transcriptional regulator [Halioglobus sp.]
MSKKNVRARVSKDQWLQCAMEVFAREGNKGVRIEYLAREIGVAKAGFYWHFKDSEDLLKNMLDFWLHEFTEIVMLNMESLDLGPKERLELLVKMVEDYDLARYDVNFRTWAKTDPVVAKKVKAVLKLRLEAVRQAISELGYADEDLEFRTHLFVCYLSNEADMFGGRGVSTKKERAHYKQTLLRMVTEQRDLTS